MCSTAVFVRILFACGLITTAVAAPAQERLPAPAKPSTAPPLPYPDTGFASPPLVLQAPPDASAVLPISETTPIVESAISPPEETISIDSNLAPEEPEAVRWYSPVYWFGPTPWDTSFELGINGSSGTSESISIRTGGAVKRESDSNKLAMSLYYNKTNADGEETQSNALFDGRNDWIMGNSRWSLFGMTQMFYDEFQAFDFNLNLSSGVGYQWLDRDWIKLGTSVGAGASREFGGVDDEWTPEANFGFNFEQYVSKTQKFYAKVDFFPEFENFGDYRALSDIGMEIELTRPSNVSLKLSATDRYDSNPDGVRPHNTNYSVLLLWKL